MIAAALPVEAAMTRHGRIKGPRAMTTAQATSTIELMTYVTCPTMRYHPAIVAQKGATMQLLSDGRFTLNLGAGENLNEHVIGRGWPAIAVRHRMLAEAITVIRGLWHGGLFSFSGEFFDVESAKVWDLPDTAPPIGIAVSGPSSCRLAGRHADIQAVQVGIQQHSLRARGAAHARQLGKMI